MTQAADRGGTPQAELVERAQRGDLAAFEDLYRAEVGRVMALCTRMVRDPATAEDLTQEAFVRAWSRLDGFRGASAFGTWLYRLTVNLVIGHLRSAGRWPDELEPAQEMRLEARPASPAHRVDLERALRTLTPKARLVFLLHDLEGYRHREIAEIAGIAEGTSRAHLHGARRKLRKALSHDV